MKVYLAIIDTQYSSSSILGIYSSSEKAIQAIENFTSKNAVDSEDVLEFDLNENTNIPL